MHKLGREQMTADTLTTAALIERVDAMDAGELDQLDRLQAAIDRRRGELLGEEVLPTAVPSSTVIERRAYASGVLQLEKRGESGPYWYFTTARTASRRPSMSVRRTPPRSSWRR
jgi:hypothetical protein